MNLVDAIRLTAREPSATAAVAHPDPPDFTSELNIEPAPPPNSMNSNFVRIELFLSPEQIQGLLKETVGSHRSIMTVREVAQLLRTTSHNVERLADEGKLPGFRLDDSWRFHKSAIDEWTAAQEKAA